MVAMLKDSTADEWRILVTHRAAHIALICDAVAALERRRVAGTLLAGKCSAVEEAWCAFQWQQGPEKMPPAQAAESSALIGYQQFMYAGCCALYVLSHACVFP